jgi:hypothetical protein
MSGKSGRTRREVLADTRTLFTEWKQGRSSNMFFCVKEEFRNLAEYAFMEKNWTKFPSTDCKMCIASELLRLILFMQDVGASPAEEHDLRKYSNIRRILHDSMETWELNIDPRCESLKRHALLLLHKLNVKDAST